MNTAIQNARTFYFAGEMFNTKHLLGNAALGQSIFEVSNGRYIAVLPQSLPPSSSAKAVRDVDLQNVLGSDLGVFQYDGTELDSGTVVEFMFAKFADIPSVLLRSDFRNGGDAVDGSTGDPWNLMTSFFPRTEVVLVNSLATYQKALIRLGGKPIWEGARSTAESVLAAQEMNNVVAEKVVSALDRVSALPSLMPAPSAETIYRWIAKLPNFAEGADVMTERLLRRLEARREREAGLR